MTSTSARRRWARRTGALMSIMGMALMGIGALAPAVEAAPAPPPAYSGPFVAESSPAPASIVAVGSAGLCEGVAPTSGSLEALTVMQVNTGQGLVKDVANDFSPGSPVHYLVEYNPTDAANSFDIVDCVVEFLPVTAAHPADNTVAILALATGPYGQLFANPPATTRVIKGFDHWLDGVEFGWGPSNQALPGEFDFAYTIPADVTPGAVVCNYAKTTGGTETGGDENRKAGACFEVVGGPTSSTTTTSSIPPSTTTTSTIASSTTTTSSIPPSTTTTSTTSPSTAATSTTTTSVGGAIPATTTTTHPVSVIVPEVATTNPGQVLPLVVTPQPVELPSTGSGTRDLTILAGLFLAAGGLALCAAGRPSSGTPGTG
jgi:hypothetical protein